MKKNTDMGRLITYYNLLEPAFRERIMGYVEAFVALKESDSKEESNE